MASLAAESSSQSPARKCALCSTSIPDKIILSDGCFFCCHGCLAVYNILLNKGEIGDYQTNPLFLQALRSGLISNPSLVEQMRGKSEVSSASEVQKMHFTILDMWCPSCADLVRLFLKQEKGVIHCIVDYATDLAMVEFNPKVLSKEKIFSLIGDWGYRPCTFDRPENKPVSSMLYLRFIVAVFFSLNVMMFAYPLYASYYDYDGEGYGKLFAWLSLAASLPVLGFSALPIYKKFVNGILAGLWGMEALVVMGISTAFAYSVYELWQGGTRVYFDSMTVIVVFMLLGKMIEAKAKFSAKESIFRLSRSIPKRGRKVNPDGTTTYVLAKDLALGDIVAVYQGEKIVLDGTVVEGSGSSDESLLTGESLPVQKKAGSQVLGGALLTTGTIKLRIDAAEEESVLRRIVQMIERDIGHKSGYVRAADRIVRWFVPLVLAAAALTAALVVIWGAADEGKGVFETAVLRSTAVFLISCPCAIGIAAPLAESHLINALTRAGAVVRNRGCLQYLGKETVIAFDKTGTITQGRYQVLEGIEALSVRQKAILKGLAEKSTHPVSFAVASAIFESPLPLDEVEEIPGKGIRGSFGGGFCLLGSSKFFMEQGFDLSSSKISQEQGEVRTTVYFGMDGRLYPLKLGDSLRSEAKRVVRSVKPAKAVLLSGDAFVSVSAVAELCGFDSFYYEKQPLDKREYIESLKAAGEIVGMVGDGINDAPALTSAQVGISVVTASDISIQVSDILLTTDSLEVVGLVRALGRQCRKITRQNLFWAFFYNVIGIGLASLGLLTPIFAAFAMVVSSLIVLFNAQRVKE